MDHLPIPKGTTHAKLRYYEHKKFSDGPFLDYPSRNGWKAEDLTGEKDHHGRRYGGRSMNEVNGFFQTWLFFGLLIRAFRCVNVTVTTADFIHTSQTGEKFLSTAKLPDFLNKWRNNKGKGQQYDDPSKVQEEFLANQLKRMKMEGKKGSKANSDDAKYESMPNGKMIREHRKFIMKYLGKESPVSNEVKAACVMLQYTMNKWVYGVNGGDWGGDVVILDPSKDYTRLVWIDEQMIKKGWCPSEVGLFRRSLQLDGQYYLSRMQTPRYEDDHSKCEVDWQRCGYKTKDWVYKTRHIKQGCKCEMVEAPHEVINIIKSGKIPIMKYSHGKLHAKGYDRKLNRYVAISHVWSDGLGNDNKNALPKCQLELMQKRVDEVDQERIRLSKKKDPYASTSFGGFWMDTLCVPVADEHKALRNSQIQKMRKIYSRASCVLVLDKWVQELSKKDDIIERTMRMFASNWQHRLWTCQEGVLAQNLFFQFHDGQQRTHEMINDPASQLQNNGRDGPARSTIPGNLLLIPAFSMGENEDDEEMTIKLSRIILSIRPRTTSKRKDEAVCLATLLGLDPGPILEISGGGADSESKICDKRMAKLYSLMDFAPQGYIFTTLPRLKIPGYRWAPSSFLGTKLFDEIYHRGDDENDWKMDNPGFIVPGDGIMAHFPMYTVERLDRRAAGTSSLYITNGDKKHYKVVRDEGKFEEGVKYVILRSYGNRPSHAVVCVKDGHVDRKDMPLKWPKYKHLSHAMMHTRTSKHEGSVPFTLKDKKVEYVVG